MIEDRKKFDFVTVFGLLVMFLYTTYYLFTRSFMPTLQDYIMTDMHLSASQWSSLTSAFSAAYGICQIIGGYTMDKIGLNILCPLLLVVGSLLNYYFSISTDLNMSIYLRYGLGATFAVASTGFLKYLSMAVPSRFFAKFMYGTYCVVGLVCTVANTITFRNIVGSLGWRKFYFTYTIIGLIIAILLFVSLNMFYRKHVHNVEKTEHEDDTNISFMNGIKHLLCNKNYIVACLFGIFISNVFYISADGWLNKLVDSVMPGLLEGDKSFACAKLYLGGTVANVLGILFSVFMLRTQMLIYILIASAGLSFILYSASASIVLMGIACMLIGITGSGQSVAFDYTEKCIPHRYLGLGFGFLNCCVMYLGCGLPQKLAGLFLDFVKGDGGVYLATHYVQLFRLGYMTIILSLICCLLFNGDKEIAHKPH